MNKTKMILAGTGGAIGLVVLVLAFLVWQGFSSKTVALEGDDEEGVEGLETVESRVQSLSRKPIYPCAESLSAIEENQTLVNDWSKDGLALVARGDRTFSATTPAAFKTFLVGDARRIAKLLGGVQGKLVKPDFTFGPFKDYIVEGKMPAEAELAELQRKWDDVATVAGILSRAGASELVDVQFAGLAGSPDGRSAEKGKRQANKGKTRVQKAEASSLIPHPSSQSYVFTFLVRPPAFVRAINELSACDRFIVIDDFAFDRTSDVIAEALGGDEKKKVEPSASGRRNRRNRRESREENPPAGARPRGEDGPVEKNGVITDPLKDAPFKVVLTVSVHDFRSVAENGESEKKGVSK